MKTQPGILRSRVVAVGLVGMLLATALVANVIDAARPDSGNGRDPYVTLYRGDRNQIEALLVTGDGQAFAALAQDPTLARPDAIVEDGEYAYRAQRPLWGYLAWAGSLGQPSMAGWALAVLTVLAAGFAAAVTARLLEVRRANPWWALVVVAAGYESIVTLTPELLAFAWFGSGLLLWSRDRRALAVAALVAAALTRETMLVGVAALAVWEMAHVAGSVGARVRRAMPLGVPVAAVIAWDAFLRMRLGAWPTGGESEARLSLPGVGLIQGLSGFSGGLIIGVVLGVALCVLAIRRAPHDVLTWTTLAYAAFALTFSEEVWTHAGFTRALLPMYVCGIIAVVRRSAEPVEVATDVAPGAISREVASSLIVSAP